MVSSFRGLSAALAAVLALTGCIQDDGTRFNPLPMSRPVAVEQERELGYRFDREVHRHLPFVDDVHVLEFLEDLGQELVRTIEPQPFVYRFRVIQEPTLNAFAVPGGYIYLHSGTVLAAASAQELAGVLAHEIAHVKARHYARLQERAAIPDLLTGIAAIAAAMVARDPTPSIAVQAANEALKLRFTREFEAEADRLGATFLVRAGYDPSGLVRFFERLVREKNRVGRLRIPPYLYSHPQVEDRIEAVSAMAENMRPLREPPPGFEERLPAVQARLAFLVAQGRSRRPMVTPFDREAAEAYLARARERWEAEDPEGALEALDAAAEVEPYDPRVPYQRGEILEAQGRLADAIAAYRRTLELDPSRALVFYRLGRLYRQVGSRPRAAFYFEGALNRASPDGDLYERAEWELRKTIFPVLTDAGLGVRSPVEDDSENPTSREQFEPEDRRAIWWGRLSPHFVPHFAKLRVRWIDPTGHVVLEDEPDPARRIFAVSELAIRGKTAGTWTVEVRFEEEVVDRRRFHLVR